jgi:hypothetical protein
MWPPPRSSIGRRCGYHERPGCWPIPFATIAGEQPPSPQPLEQRGAASKIISAGQVGERAEDGAYAKI